MPSVKKIIGRRPVARGGANPERRYAWSWKLDIAQPSVFATATPRLSGILPDTPTPQMCHGDRGCASQSVLVSCETTPNRRFREHQRLVSGEFSFLYNAPVYVLRSQWTTGCDGHNAFGFGSRLRKLRLWAGQPLRLDLRAVRRFDMITRHAAPFNHVIRPASIVLRFRGSITEWANPLRGPVDSRPLGCVLPRPAGAADLHSRDPRRTHPAPSRRRCGGLQGLGHRDRVGGVDRQGAVLPGTALSILARSVATGWRI